VRAGVPEELTPVAGLARRVGPYLLHELIGRGGMAEVFAAERPASLAGNGPRNCVVKTIRGDLSEELAQMFADEIRVMRLLDHPNIVRTFDHGIAGGALYLAMERLDGVSVGRLLRALHKTGKPMPVELAAYIAHQVALALAHAHAATDPQGRPLGLVHRDISPGNVMLLDSGQVKLVDFGIAKIRHHLRRTTTQVDMVKGKVAYMAPEYLMGRPFDGRADLFALGVLTWEMLAGRPLFSRGTHQDTATEVLRGTIPSLATFRSGVPTTLETLVLQLLERDPRRRIPGGAELAAALTPLIPTVPHPAWTLARMVSEVSKQKQTPARSLTPYLKATAAPAPAPPTPPPAAALPLRPVPALVPPRRRRHA